MKLSKVVIALIFVLSLFTVKKACAQQEVVPADDTEPTVCKIISSQLEIIDDALYFMDKNDIFYSPALNVHVQKIYDECETKTNWKNVLVRLEVIKKIAFATVRNDKMKDDIVHACKEAILEIKLRQVVPKSKK